jgi:transcriptional regulator with XRE-family HTH domain
MNDLSTRIIQRRKELNLSLEDVSEHTKIRPHIIEEIENGNLDVLPSVYMKAFLKTYCSFLKIPLNDIPEKLTKKEEPKIEQTQSFVERRSQSNKPKTHTEEVEKRNIQNTGSELKSHKKVHEDSDYIEDENFENDFRENEPQSYKELFKKSAVPKKNINYINIGIYSGIGLIILVVVYFSFIYSSENKKNNDILQTETTLTIKDTAEKKEESKNLFNYFNKGDSLVLSAEAKGESWLRIEMDGKKVDEVLLKPDMKQKWVAEEFFLITQGNVGSVIFKINGEVLKPFGNPGTVAKNIKVTADTVLNTNPVNENQNRTRVVRKKKEKKTPKLIEPSPIPNSNFLEEKQRDTFRL